MFITEGQLRGTHLKLDGPDPIVEAFARAMKELRAAGKDPFASVDEPEPVQESGPSDKKAE